MKSSNMSICTRYILNEYFLVIDKVYFDQICNKQSISKLPTHGKHRLGIKGLKIASGSNK